jgi:hypothetical protein
MENQKIDKNILLVIILALGTLLYVIAVIWIGVGSVRHVNAIEMAAKKPAAQQAQPQPGEEEPKAPVPYPISPFITQALLVIGTALATHLGAYLGIAINNNGDVLKDLKSWLAYALTPEGFSGVLALVYLLSLIAAIGFWAVTGFSEYAGKPLHDLSYSFLGVFAGAMAALSKG